MSRQPGFEGSTAHEFSSRRFGGPVRPRSRVVSVATTPTQVLDNNPRRVYWLIVNRAVNNGAFDIAADVTAANGILLGAGGGFASMDVELDGETVGYEVWGIQDVAAGSWRVFEVFRV